MPKTGYIPTVHTKLHSRNAGEVSIFFQLQKHGTRYKIFPGEKIDSRQWDARRQRAKTGKGQVQNLQLNDRLDEWEKLIRQTWEEHYREGFTPETFRQLVFEAKQGEESKGIAEWMGEYLKQPLKALQSIDELGEHKKRLLLDFLRKTDRYPQVKRLARGETVAHVGLIDFTRQVIRERIEKRTVKRRSVYPVENCYRALLAYQKVFGFLDYDLVNWDFLDRWKEFSYSEYSFPLRYKGEVIQYEKTEWEQNYASKMLSIVKMIVNEARKKKYTNNTIVKEHGFSIPTNDGNAAMMYFEDVRQIDGARLPEKLQNIRNLVIRAFCTGLRYSDWYKISDENMHVLGGKKVLEVWAQKTGKPVTIPMLPLFERILKEPEPRYISNQKFNDYVKELCEVVELTHPITWTSYAGGVRSISKPRLCDKISAHDLRRSALTNFVLMNMQGIANLPDALVRLISGHSSDAMFQKYIRIGDRLKAANMTQEFLQEKREYLFS